MEEIKLVHSSIKAGEWGVSNNYVENLCKNKRISGAVMRGTSWYLPSTTPKPVYLPSKSPKTVRSSYGGSDPSGFGGKRFVFSIIALLLILIAFIISVNGSAQFIVFNDRAVYATYTLNGVIWGASSLIYHRNDVFNDSSVSSVSCEPIQFLCVVLVIAIIIGIVAVILSKHENMNGAYFAFAMFLLFGAIAMFTCKDNIESAFRNIEGFGNYDEFSIVYGGPIATGIFLLLSGASMVVAGIFADE